MAFLLDINVSHRFMAKTASAGTSVTVMKQRPTAQRGDLHDPNFLELLPKQCMRDGVYFAIKNCHHSPKGWNPLHPCVYCSTGLKMKDLDVIESGQASTVREPYRSFCYGNFGAEEDLTCAGPGVCDGSCIERFKDWQPVQSRPNPEHRPYKPSYLRANQEFERQLAIQGILEPSSHHIDSAIPSPCNCPDSPINSSKMVFDKNPARWVDAGGQKKPTSILRPPAGFKLDKNRYGVNVVQDQNNSTRGSKWSSNEGGGGGGGGTCTNITTPTSSGHKHGKISDDTEYVRSPEPELKHPSPVRRYATPLAHKIGLWFDTRDRHWPEGMTDSDRYFFAKVFDDYEREDLAEKMKKTWGDDMVRNEPADGLCEMQDAETESLLMADAFDEEVKLEATELLLVRELRRSWRIKGARANEASRYCAEMTAAMFPHYFRNIG